jgi:hypothetical protein
MIDKYDSKGNEQQSFWLKALYYKHFTMNTAQCANEKCCMHSTLVRTQVCVLYAHCSMHAHSTTETAA